MENLPDIDVWNYTLLYTLAFSADVQEEDLADVDVLSLYETTKSSAKTDIISRE